MKTYKKSTLLLGLTMLSGIALRAGNFTILPAPKMKNNLFRVISQAHDNFFYGPNLFDRRLFDFENMQRERAWNQALYRLQNYVANNAKGFLNITDLINEIGVELANTIRDGYEQAFGGSVEQRKDKRSIGYRELENNIAGLLRRKKELQNYIAELKETAFITVYPPPPSKKVRDLLLQVLPLLQNTIKRTVINFIKESRANGFLLRPSLIEKIKKAYPYLIDPLIL